jgi:flotillin
MTTEKLQFSLPAVFTIGPDNEADALKKYALLLSGSTSEGDFAKAKDLTDPTRRDHVQDIVKGIIEGETRVIVSSMTMEEIFKERQVFKTKGPWLLLCSNLQLANVILSSHSKRSERASTIWTENVRVAHCAFVSTVAYAFHSYNANVKELQDTPGSEYFAFLSRKAHEGALNQAKIDVAEARMRGEIGEAEKKGRAKQEISKIDADTAVLETKRKAEKAKADSELMNRQTELDNSVRLAKIAAQRQAEMRDAELQKQVESKRAETELERLRAVEVTKSKVARESAQENADASFYTEQKAADAQLYRRKIEADATCTFLGVPFPCFVLCTNDTRLSPEQRGRRRFLSAEARGRRNSRNGQSIWRARRCSWWPSGFPAV